MNYVIINENGEFWNNATGWADLICANLFHDSDYLDDPIGGSRIYLSQRNRIIET